MKVDLTPINVGFDVKVLGMEVQLPSNVTEVYYLDNEGKERIAKGGIDQIIRELESYGYKVAYVGDGQ